MNSLRHVIVRRCDEKNFWKFLFLYLQYFPFDILLLIGTAIDLLQILSFFYQQYFAFDILLLIGTAIAAYFVFTDDLDSLKKPFLEALKQYDDTSNNQADKTLVRAWDSFQQDVSFFYNWIKKNNVLIMSFVITNSVLNFDSLFWFVCQPTLKSDLKEVQFTKNDLFWVKAPL